VVPSWGARGLALSLNDNIESEIFAIEQIGNTLYVGGRFQEALSRRFDPPVDQPFLMALNATTGQFLNFFRPDLDGAVYALKAAPDGSRLYVGGEFYSVNGEPGTGALVALDPRSGRVVDGWQTHLNKFFSVGSALVKTLDLSGGYLYAGGSFTNTTDATGTRRTASNVARFRVSDSTVDQSCAPEDAASATASEASGAQPAAAAGRVALRALVVAVGADDFGVATSPATLDRVGAAYDVLHTRDDPLTSQMLVRPDGTGNYNAVLLTNSMLLYPDATGTFVSGLSADEWSLLWAYERDVGPAPGHAVHQLRCLARGLLHSSGPPNPNPHSDWTSYRDPLTDVTLLRRLTGLEPTVGLEEGIQHTFEWYRDRWPR
jgi:hypothetical protein